MRISKTCNLLMQLMLVTMLSSCFFYNFFKKDSKTNNSGSSSNEGVYGSVLGDHASGIDEAALSSLYSVGTDYPPAAVRPDPDTYIRNILRQYQSDGIAMARQIGSIEQYRPLLGGANEDFSKPPQKSYDATSLISSMKVAEFVCEGLVNPNPWTHEGWTSILPYAADDVTRNLEFLATKIVGIPEDQITSAMIDSLEEIYDASRAGENDAYAFYIAPCMALSLHPVTLLL